ncbi:MAG: corrinoid protein [Candidatus Korobacteraceae bacterium]|jgi:corrinoid protein of di/trimethylamine methyltransferase
MTELTKLFNAILTGDNKTAIACTQQAIAEGVQPMELITSQMIPAMAEVGRRFESEEYYVPELLLSARAMKGALALLRPLLAASGTQPVARIVIGTVKGDLHDIGKNLVSSMLEGGGFEVVDLGTDVTPEKFIQAIQQHQANIVALSALLTVTMPMMKNTIEALKQASLRDHVKVMVGGAPVTREYADSIGADGYSESATGAVAVARQLAPVS